MTEKTTLENQTSLGNNRILSDASYKKIKTDVNKISKLMPGKTPGDQEPLPMLLEIEKYVHKLIKMLETAENADKVTVQTISSKIKSQLRIQRNNERMRQEEAATKREQERKLAERAKVVVNKNKKPIMPRSEKTTKKKKEEKKQILTPEEIDMNKYLG